MLKVINGQRSAIECALIEAICLDKKDVYSELCDRLKRRADHLTLVDGPDPTEPDIPRQLDEAPI